MFCWLRKKCRSFSVKYTVTSDDHKYGFGRQVDQSTETSDPISHHRSTQHIYEEIGDTVHHSENDDLAYAITSLVEITDCGITQRPFSELYFPASLQTVHSYDSGFDSGSCSDEDTTSTTSSSYQPINTVPVSFTHKVNQGRSMKASIPKRKLFLARVQLGTQKCRRWLLTHAVPHRPCEKTNKISPAIHHYTRDHLLLKKIEETWLDTDDDASDGSEDSQFSLDFSVCSSNCDLDLLNLSAEPTHTLTSSTGVNVVERCDCDSGRSSLYQPESLSECEPENGSDSDEVGMDDEYPYFNPGVGFGLNRWYNPAL